MDDFPQNKPEVLIKRNIPPHFPLGLADLQLMENKDTPVHIRLNQQERRGFLRLDLSEYSFRLNIMTKEKGDIKPLIGASYKNWGLFLGIRHSVLHKSQYTISLYEMEYPEMRTSFRVYEKDLHQVFPNFDLPTFYFVKSEPEEQ